MTLDDFVRQPSDRWRAKEPLATPMGKFEIELDAEAPDAELVVAVTDLAQFVAEHYDDVLEFVYQHYLRCSEEKRWMKSCDVPVGLASNRVAKYLRSRSISVVRKRDQTIDGTIFVGTKWDPEHAIWLEVRNGHVVPKDI